MERVRLSGLRGSGRSSRKIKMKVIDNLQLNRLRVSDSFNMVLMYTLSSFYLFGISVRPTL